MQATTARAEPNGYTIQGRTITMPCVVRDACSASATWLVDARAAQQLLPGPELEIAQVLPGRGLLSIACIDYRDNDLGDYNEISVAFFVRARGMDRSVPYVGTAFHMLRGTLPTYIHRLPVSQPFTCEACRKIWGFPKTVDDIDFDYSGDSAVCTWEKDGERVFRLSLPRGGSRALPKQHLRTYSYLQGVPHQTRFVSSAEELGVGFGRARLELGNHPIAAELSSLGLPKRALMTLWMDRMKAEFEGPQKL